MKLFDVFPLFDVNIVKGRGCHVWDDKGQEYLDITPQAAELMGKKGKPDEHVFGDIYTPYCTNETIRKWVLRAGINKDISFHQARHIIPSYSLKTKNLQRLSA